MAKAFSIEDGNQSGRTLVQSRGRDYSDLDLQFIHKPSGDVYKKNQAAAVKQAVKNLLLTGTGEKPFNPSFGGELGTALFELDTDYNPNEIAEQINSCIERYEPRAKVLNIDITSYPDRNELRAKIVFEIQNIGEVVTIDVDLARLR